MLANVKVAVADSTIHVEGPLGKLTFPFRPEMGVSYDEAKRQVVVTRPNDERQNRALHGLTRSLIANMVQGVTEGYTKKLEIVGVGYQAQLKKADTVELQVGYANRVVMTAPEGVKVVVADPTHTTISGPDKQRVGQFAAEIRKVTAKDVKAMAGQIIPAKNLVVVVVGDLAKVTPQLKALPELKGVEFQTVKPF